MRELHVLSCNVGASTLADALFCSLIATTSGLRKSLGSGQYSAGIDGRETTDAPGRLFVNSPDRRNPFLYRGRRIVPRFCGRRRDGSRHTPTTIVTHHKNMVDVEMFNPISQVRAATWYTGFVSPEIDPCINSRHSHVDVVIVELVCDVPFAEEGTR